MIYLALENLIEYGIQKELISRDDVFVIKNQLMEILHLEDWKETKPTYKNK